MKNKLKDWHQDIKSQSSVMATSQDEKVLVLGGGGFIEEILQSSLSNEVIVMLFLQI